MQPPPPIDRNELQKLAELARLHVPAERVTTVTQHLQRIVAAFDALRSEKEEATVPPVPVAPLRLRPDVAEPPLTTEVVLRNAPRQAAGMFVVPRVVDA